MTIAHENLSTVDVHRQSDSQMFLTTGEQIILDCKFYSF